MKLKNQLIKLKTPDRLYEINGPLIGLTGGIASGKSTVSKILKDQGFAVIDADGLVKSIYAQDETKDFVKSNFAGAWINGAIHFPTLRELAFQDQNVRMMIEQHIYARLSKAFLDDYQRLPQRDVVFYDVPLLFEKGLDGKFDLNVLVYCPREIQLERLMNRDKIGRELAERMLDQQMPIEDKKMRADYIIKNVGNEKELLVEVEELLKKILD